MPSFDSAVILQPSSFLMDPYHTLGVLKGCTREEAKDAYRAMAWQMHPDRGGEEQAFIQLDAAYKQVLEDLDRFPSNPAGNAPRSPVKSPPGHQPEPSWEADWTEFEDEPPIPRPPRPPDPSFAPDFVLFDLPPRPATPFDPSFDPDLVLLDGPTRAPKPPGSRAEPQDFSTWLRGLSDQTQRETSWWQSEHVTAILTKILLILIVVSVMLTWIRWVMPED